MADVPRKPAAPESDKRRIVGRLGDADLLIGRSHAALVGGDVGTAFQQLRRKHAGDGRNGGRSDGDWVTRES